MRKVRENSHNSQYISFVHLYKEFNTEADLLAKEVAQVILGTLHIEHSIEGLSLSPELKFYFDNVSLR
jgi:hypothetical protein